MTSNNGKNVPVLSVHDEARPTIDGMNVEQYLEQLHADFDPVYSMLMDYQCAVMEVETKFNILNNWLSIQGEHNPIESIKSRVLYRKREKGHVC